MYTSRTGLTLGFHGTDEAIAQAVLNGRAELKAQNNPYDWLGNGIYFWDNSPSRALQWATELSVRPKSHIRKPAVIGAILDLGHCLDLLDYDNLAYLHEAHQLLVTTLEATSTRVPVNSGKTHDLLFRELDCAVIETLHASFAVEQKPAFDSVRGVFWEGDPIYHTAGFREKNHIQICVRNLDCIKGYFLPLLRITS
ncbi:MAG: hypothetical protein H7330_14090 [Hymenobacteraceae bacterium]|nr:hypothetical protein [Hymenobacteraceae bacterium]